MLSLGKKIKPEMTQSSLTISEPAVNCVR
jgi:hypothetical protein